MAGQITSNPLSPAPNLYASSTDPVALFTKSIKQEPKDFPVIKSLNQWDSVKRVVNATATVQSIAEVLNHTYIPSVEDKPLFDLKNSYWYKVLVDIIQESSLQAIVNAGPVGDGQTVWTNIVTEAKKSMMAHISLQSLTTYLTTSKIRDGSWQGTDTAYLNHWNEQMCKLVEYAKFYSIDMWRDMVSLALNLTSRKYTKILPGKAAHLQFLIPSQQKTRSRNCTTSTPVGQ
jgi:hypothetical protein